jgi:peptidoglycan biosynthesis protein MviN/MurJ (putative lipid II flippase)
MPGLVLPFALTLRFTAGHLTDAYFYAFALALLPSTLLSVVLETNVLPAAEDHRRRGRDSLNSFASHLVRQALAVGIVVYGVIGTIGLLLISDKGNWSTSEKNLCAVLVLVFAVYVVAVSASSVLAGCLHAVGDFFTTTSTQGIRSLLPLLLVFVIPRTSTGVAIAASALAVGELARALLLRHRLHTHSSRLVPDLKLDAPPRKVWSVALPHGLALSAALANPTIDRVIAASLAAGSVTLLDLTEKVMYAPLVALNSSIILVAGARWAKQDPTDIATLTLDLRRTLRRTAVFACLIGTVIIGGAFGGTTVLPATVAGVDIAKAAGLLAILLVGLPAATTVTTMLRFLTVTQFTKWLPAVSIVTVIINASGDVVGAKLIGLYGIAIASTAIRFVDALLLSMLSRRRIASLRTVAQPA